ncbi:MAG: hypothetical protein FWD32_02870 [Firmicutes bacterium]|nr:hypothetical protein [Bacillota bacterium]
MARGGLFQLLIDIFNVTNSRKRLNRRMQDARDGIVRTNKYDMFKNQRRKNTLKATNRILSLITILSMVALIACFAIAFFIVMVLFVLIVVTLGLILHGDLSQYMQGLGALVPIMAICLIIFVVAFVLRFTVQYLFMAREGAELKKNKDVEGMQKYIDVANAVKKVEIAGLIYVVFILITMVGGILLCSLGDMAIVLGIVSIILGFVLMGFNSSFKRKTYRAVNQQVIDIRAEITQNSLDKKAAKQNAKLAKTQGTNQPTIENSAQ